jgi:NitT/TauT family transport system substrate-binding protein
LCVCGCDPWRDWGKDAGKSVTPSHIEKTVFCAGGPGAFPILVAAEAGMFKREGLDVEIKTFTSGSLALEAMLAGRCGFATSAETPIVFKSFERNDFSIVSGIASSDNAVKLVARKSAGGGALDAVAAPPPGVIVKKPSDLEGRRIGVQKATTMHMFLYMFLAKNGLAESDVTIVFGKPDELVEMLVKGGIDALAANEIMRLNALKALGTDALVMEMPGIYVNAHYLAAMRGFAYSHQKTVTKVLRALLSAEDLMRRDPRQAARHISGRLNSDASSIESSLSEFRWRISLDQSMFIVLEDTAKWAMDSHLTDRTVLPNYLDYVYGDALLSVSPDAVTIIK